MKKGGEMGMIRRSAEKQVDKREGLFGGSGGALVRSLLNGPEEMYERAGFLLTPHFRRAVQSGSIFMKTNQKPIISSAALANSTITGQ